MSALAIERLTYTYPGAPRPALREVSLRVEEGELVVLAGLSGSGKSTLLRAACGLVPHFHGGEAAGRVTVCGLDTREHGPGRIAAVAGTLLQDPETQVVMGTVRAELALPLENRGEPPAAVARGVEEAALALGIAGLLDRPTAELSGGELQRVALAAALAGRPRLVLLDEPTSQLDPVAGDELIWLLRRLNEEWGVAVVLAEHRLERCLSAADRVVALLDGRVACDAPPAEMLTWAMEAAPALATPAAGLFARAGLAPAPAGVKQARAALRARGLLPAPADPAARTGPDESAPRRPRLGRRARGDRDPALRVRGAWCELPGGRAVLRGVDLELGRGETVALMGRNGAGKSTLLRHIAGLATPTRGRVEAAGRVALLLQGPGDYLIADRVGALAPPAALAAAGLEGMADRHPRDLSGGERQRLALALVGAAGDGAPPAVVALDEPTRGMDRAWKEELATLLRERAAAGAAVIVATHDTELAATVASRVVLLGSGEVAADGSARELLCGGWHFATETARVLGGAGGALLPEQGAALLGAATGERVG
ncbi:MAG: ATP-binding cassette domain-containing protein [Solirubrobacteraceae bacterium]